MKVAAKIFLIFNLAGLNNKSFTKRLRKIAETGSLEEVKNIFSGEYEGLDELNDEWGEEEETDKKQLTSAEKGQLKREIEELEEFSKLAESIKTNAKGEVMQTALTKGFKKLKELKAPEKALIFTEFKRTQAYLYEILSKTEYKDKIVLFNGSNNDELSQRIYEKWLNKHKGTDKVTGSKTGSIENPNSELKKSA